MCALFTAICLTGQPVPSERFSADDKAGIKAAIDEQARKDNLAPRRRAMMRGPVQYDIDHISWTTADVAIVDASARRPASMSGPKLPVTFVAVRRQGQWTVAREIATCGWGEPGIMPVSECPRCGVRGSSGYPD